MSDDDRVESVASDVGSGSEEPLFPSGDLFPLN